VDLSAPHTGFVVASYVVSGAAIVGLVVVTLMKLRAQERKLMELQMPGRRRSGADDDR
jgi:heme exporter protein CcmD